MAYASLSLNPQERQYSMTELEILAVVWPHHTYHYYLYGHNVKLYTIHSSVKAVLNSRGKHAKWWMHAYGRGVKGVQITHRAGKENVNADALS